VQAKSEIETEPNPYNDKEEFKGNQGAANHAGAMQRE
jgi:hypothetical protein